MADTTSNWTIPNVLTVVRILLTPAFVMAFVGEQFVTAWVLFAAGAVTDAMDGYLARRLRQRSRLGAMLDPLADKFLLVTAFASLGLKDWIPPWLAIMVVSRDIIIVGGLAVLHFFGADIRLQPIRPTWASKVNTALQLGLIILVLAARTFGHSGGAAASVLFFLVAAFTLVTGVHYILIGMERFPERDR